MKKSLLALAFLAFLGQTAGAAESHSGYWVDGSGKIVHSGSGECWRSGSWSPENKTPECDQVEVSIPLKEVAVREPSNAVQLPIAPVTEKQVLMAEVHFGFNQFTLTDQARLILDDVVSKSQTSGAQIDGVWINGHADRIGSELYNHRLAMRRALAVSDYLAARGVRASTMDIHEEGTNKPLVACDNVKARAALISCLAPNRRVELKVDIVRSVNPR